MLPQSSNKSNASLLYYLEAVTCVVLMFGFGYLPAPAPITPFGMKVLGIFFGLLFGWSVIGLIWPSIIGLLGLVLIGSMSMDKALAGGWGSSTLMLILFMVIVAGIVEQSGVSRFIAMYFITRKWVLGRPWAFISVFLLTVFCLAAVTSTIPTIIIGWSILYSICRQVGYKPYEPFPSFMVVGVAVAASYGLLVFPFRPVGILVFGILKDMTGISVNYLAYTMFALPLGVLFIAALCLFAKIFFRIDVTLLRQLNENSFKDVDLTLTKHQKVVLGFVITLIVMLLIPSVLPKSFFLATILGKLQAVGTAAFLIAVMCCIKVDGKPVMNYKEVASKGMQWDVIFLTSVVMPLSGVLTAKETGVTAYLVKTMGPLFQDQSTFVFLAIAVAAATFFTNFAVNNVVGAVLLPVFYPFAAALGIAPLALTSLLVVSCHFAFLTPAASPMAALLHGNSEWCRPKDVYMYGFLVVISSFIATCLVGIPYTLVMFR